MPGQRPGRGQARDAAPLSVERPGVIPNPVIATRSSETASVIATRSSEPHNPEPGYCNPVERNRFGYCNPVERTATRSSETAVERNRAKPLAGALANPGRCCS